MQNISKPAAQADLSGTFDMGNTGKGLIKNRTVQSRQ